ncbi:hypothetical protein [Streptomyces sp. NPDC101776]|uniref:hypothetical protein n=1 Tax=Streptomyces sp. NPDC101776 TaxID=3366146 RepID=UPI0038056508
MRSSRGVLLILFALPLLLGVLLLAAGSDDGAPDCTGLHLGANGKARSGAMRRGDLCRLSYDKDTGRSAGTSTYQQLEFAQELERRTHHREGAWLTLYGAVGMGVAAIVTRRRSSAA